VLRTLPLTTVFSAPFRTTAEQLTSSTPPKLSPYTFTLLTPPKFLPLVRMFGAGRRKIRPPAAFCLVTGRGRHQQLARRIMGKPADAGEAAEFLLALSGRRHQVITSVAVRRGDRLWTRDVVSAVKMKRLSDEELNAYLATGDWQGKAGAYAIQGPAGALIPWINGSFTGIVGLPLAETATLLRAAGWTQNKETAA